jgi:hypothetical protein
MGCKAALRPSLAYDETWWRSRSCASDMTKKYQLVRDRIAVPGGGFVEALRMALIDLSCLGESHLDLTGYPHDSEAAAMASDWAALGVDMRAAAEKVSMLAQVKGKDEGGRRSRSQEAAKGSDPRDAD